MTNLIKGTKEYTAMKAKILADCGVVKTEDFDVKSAIDKRIKYLKEKLRSTGMKGYVLGISGGVDSTTTGRLCQLACDELRQEGYQAHFIAMRLPAGVQRDEEDAQTSIKIKH
jgi:NAD+ synthase